MASFPRWSQEGCFCLSWHSPEESRFMVAHTLRPHQKRKVPWSQQIHCFWVFSHENSTLMGNVAGNDQSLSQNYFLFYRTPDGKLYASRILRIENINEKNLNFSYNCSVASEGGTDIISFVLLKKGMGKFCCGSLWKLGMLRLRDPLKIATLSFYTPGSKLPRHEMVNLVSQAFRLTWG